MRNEPGIGGPRPTCRIPRRVRQGAFSLLEVLVALALLGVLATIFVVNVSTLLNRPNPNPEEVFWKAVTEARKYALLQGKDVRLAYDAKAKAFDASTSEGIQRFPVPIEGDLELDFLGPSKDGRMAVLIGGVRIETQPLSYVTFYADGTCTDFRVQLRFNRGEPYYLQIDPWTCAPVLKEKDPGGFR